MVQLIINQNWFRQWLGTEKTLSPYLSQWWSRPMVHIWVIRIDWVDCFTVLGKYIHAEKNSAVWAHEGYLHPHSWKWAIPTPQVGSGRRTGRPYFVKSPMRELGPAAAKYTRVKQCTFHWFISSELVQKQRVFNSLTIQHLIMVNCISYENIFTISVPKCINISVRFLRRSVGPRPATLLSGLQLQKRVGPAGRQLLYLLYWADSSTIVKGYWHNKILFKRYTFSDDPDQH